jgi:4-amino-4-deoxy-L-arabinose transferase-like glycosyltransferase
LLLVLLLSLVIRLVLLTATVTTPLQIQDEQQYAAIASNLVHAREFALTPGELTSMRPPLYPAFVAMLWTLAGSEDPQVVRGAQVGLGLLLVVLTYFVALRLYSRREAVLAAAVVAFYPSLLYAGVLVLTEVLFTVFVMGFVLLFLTLLDRPRAWVAVAMGALLGMAALTRSVLWPFPVVLLPLLIAAIRAPMPKRLVVAGCCFVGFVAIVGPWAVRNTRLQHTLTVVDTMGGMNLRMGNYEYTPEDRMWDAVRLSGEKNWSYEAGQTIPGAATWIEGQKDKWAQRAALDYMVRHPWITFRRSVLKFADFWGQEREMIAALRARLYNPPRWFALLAMTSVLIAYPLVVLSAALGVWLAVPAERRGHWLILTVIAFVNAIHTLVFGHSRYHLPLVPLLAVYAAAAWTSGSWRTLVVRPRAASVSIVLMVVLVAGWSHEVLFRDTARIHALFRVWL